MRPSVGREGARPPWASVPSSLEPGGLGRRISHFPPGLAARIPSPGIQVNQVRGNGVNHTHPSLPLQMKPVRDAICPMRGGEGDPRSVMRLSVCLSVGDFVSVPRDLSNNRFSSVSPTLDPFWLPRLGLHDAGWQRSAFRGCLYPFHSYFVFLVLARL